MNLIEIYQAKDRNLYLAKSGNTIVLPFPMDEFVNNVAYYLRGLADGRDIGDGDPGSLELEILNAMTFPQKTLSLSLIDRTRLRIPLFEFVVVTEEQAKIIKTEIFSKLGLI